MKIIYCLLLIILLPVQFFAATIKGIVTDEATLEPLIGVNIILNEGKIGACTNLNGFYLVKNVPVGKHLIYVSYFGYATFTDSIIIQEENQISEVSFELAPGIVQIDTVAEIENYHNYFNNYNPKNTLKIKLDSLVACGSERIKIYSTFYNVTDTSIYVIRDIDCLRMVEPIIKNSNGKLMKINSMFYDCMGMKELPDSSDFIKIPPNDSISYPPAYLYFNDFSRYPIDIYKIKLEYKYKRRTTLPGIYSDPKLYKKKFKKQLYYYNMTFRGEFKSFNYLKFNNTKLVK